MSLFQLRRGAASSPPTSSNVVIAQTQQKFVSINSWLSAIPAENDITCTVTGPVKMAVWPFDWSAMSQSTGDPARTWVKRELWAFSNDGYTSNIAAVTASATVGTAAGTWTFSAKTGANETGGTSTYQVIFDVTSAARTSWVQGRRSLAGYGGADLNTYGSATDWTITSQPSGNYFAIWNYAAFPIRADPSNQWERLAFAGSFGATVSVPVGSYSVTVQSASLSKSVTLTMVVVEGQRTVCPMMDAYEADQTSQVYTMISRTDKCYGDHIVMMDGNYGGTKTNATAISAGTALPTVNSATPSVDAPTTPYVVSGSPDGLGISPNGLVTAHPGWCVVRAENPGGATICEGGHLGVNFSAMPGSTLKAGYMRFHNLKALIAVDGDTGGSASAVTDLMIDHCWNIAPTGAAFSQNINWSLNSDRSFRLYMLDNYSDGQNRDGYGIINLIAQDGQFVGNFSVNNGDDTFNSSTYNLTSDSGKNFSSWNFVTWRYAANPNHTDMWQPSPGALYIAAATGSTVYQGEVVGNLLCQGQGGVVTAAGSTQGYYSAGFGFNWYLYQSQRGGTTLFSKVRFIGNFFNDAGAYALGTPPLATGSVVTNNGWLVDPGIIDNFLNGGHTYTGLGIYQGSGAGAVPFSDPIDAQGFPPGNCTTSRNFSAHQTTANVYQLGGTSVGNPYSNNLGLNIGAGNDWTQIQNATYLTTMAALFENSTLGANLKTVADAMSAFQPKAGTAPLAVTPHIGPFAPKAVRKIDHRRRTYDSSLLA